MRLAFYAPLKPPDHETPSGDRAVAQGLLKALAGLGAQVNLASTLRSRDPLGDPVLQVGLIAQAEAEIARLIPLGRHQGWQGWVTYHNYYKAPDLIGPAVCAALGIPYLLIEATRARKRLTSPWARFATRAEAATDAAKVVFYFTQRDHEALHVNPPPGQKLIHLHPFLAQEALPPASDLTGSILSVGMMRAGDKLASYRIIADTLALLPPSDWKVEIAGDGPQRAQVEQMMAPFGGRVRFLGALSADDLTAAYTRAGLFFWPGVNEAFGMSYLEAQAAGLPVVAQDRPGVRDVLAPGPYPGLRDGNAPLAARIAYLLETPDARAAAGAAGREMVQERHLLPAAQATLLDGLHAAGVTP